MDFLLVGDIYLNFPNLGFRKTDEALLQQSAAGTDLMFYPLFWIQTFFCLDYFCAARIASQIVTYHIFYVSII